MTEETLQQASELKRVREQMQKNIWTLKNCEPTVSVDSESLSDLDLEEYSQDIRNILIAKAEEKIARINQEIKML